MVQTPLPLTALSEEQRAQALQRYDIIRPALEKQTSQAQVARTHKLSPSTVQLWIKQYREKDLAGLTHARRSDKGSSRRLPEQAIRLVEGLALQTPPRSAASIHRQVSAIANEQGWKPPSYERVRQIIKTLDPALVTMAHQGAAAYREEFDLLYHRQASHATLTLAAFEQRFRTWLLEDYHQRIHEETRCKPAERWEAGGFVPRMPRSLEQLDLLLLTVAKTRRVQQDGIRFQGYRYIDPTLAGYVKEDVVIRYDPADLAEIRVFYHDRFLCRAICQELAGQTVSLNFPT
jgi:transposase-like protein